MAQRASRRGFRGDVEPLAKQIGSVLLREADGPEIDRLLSFRNDPEVNRFMMRTSVDPDVFRKNWLAIPTSDTDFSCVAEVEGAVAAMGFLELFDGMGQPGMPARTQGRIGYIVDPPFSGRGVSTSPGEGRHATGTARSRGLVARRTRLGGRLPVRHPHPRVARPSVASP